MRKKFLLFLNKEVNGLTPRSVYYASVMTAQYYTDKTLLVTKHSLRSYHYPWLWIKQRQQNRKYAQMYLSHKTHELTTKTSRFSDPTQVQPIPIDRYSILKNSLASGPTLYQKAQEAFTEAKEEGPLSVQISGTLLNLWRMFKRANWVTELSTSIVYYINLYHKALQAMIEGHREVTSDHKTILKDGQTVEEKLKKVMTT